MSRLCSSLSAPAQAQVGVSVTIGQPGFYGRIDLGDAPPPVLIYRQPIAVEYVPYYRPPIYLRVPPGSTRRVDELPEHFEISAATGEFERYIRAGNNEEVLPPPVVASLHEAYLHK